MSFKSSNESGFSKIVEGQSEETARLLDTYTDVTKEVVSGARLERREEELSKQSKRDEGTEKQPVHIKSD